MSIVEKLPVAPEGWEWKTSVFLDADDLPKIHISLEALPSPAPPVYPDSYTGTSAFSDPDESAVILAAGELLEEFKAGVDRTLALREATAFWAEEYSDLLTGTIPEDEE